MEIAVDILELEDFKATIQRSGSAFLDKLFTKNEQQNSEPEHLAGIFCVKECAIKAGIIKVGEWLSIEIKKDALGKPFLYWVEGIKISDTAISISHTKNYCVANLIKV
ncbi:MAG: 4'-phosphopantetheinyl transferase superfamily protein [Patescibacteria group bacterium]